MAFMQDSEYFLVTALTYKYKNTTQLIIVTGDISVC